MSIQKTLQELLILIFFLGLAYSACDTSSESMNNIKLAYNITDATDVKNSEVVAGFVSGDIYGAGIVDYRYFIQRISPATDTVKWAKKYIGFRSSEINHAVLIDKAESYGYFCYTISNAPSISQFSTNTGVVTKSFLTTTQLGYYTDSFVTYAVSNTLDPTDTAIYYLATNPAKKVCKIIIATSAYTWVTSSAFITMLFMVNLDADTIQLNIKVSQGVYNLIKVKISASTNLDQISFSCNAGSPKWSSDSTILSAYDNSDTVYNGMGLYSLDSSIFIETKVSTWRISKVFTTSTTLSHAYCIIIVNNKVYFLLSTGASNDLIDIYDTLTSTFTRILIPYGKFYSISSKNGNIYFQRVSEAGQYHALYYSVHPDSIMSVFASEFSVGTSPWISSTEASISTSYGTVTTDSSLTTGTIGTASTSIVDMTLVKVPAHSYNNVIYSHTTAQSFEVNSGASKTFSVPVACSTSDSCTFSSASIGGSGEGSAPAWVAYDSSTSTLSITAPTVTADTTTVIKISNALTSPYAQSFSREISIKVIAPPQTKTSDTSNTSSSTSSTSSGDVCIGIGIDNTGGCVVTLIVIFGAVLGAAIISMIAIAWTYKKVQRCLLRKHLENEIKNLEPVANEFDPIVETNEVVQNKV